MLGENETAAPVSAEHDTLYVAIEISQKSWVIAVKEPGQREDRPALAGAGGDRRPEGSDREAAGQG